MLRSSTAHWKEHLAAMDYLRQGIHLRGYAQKNPKQEYKREAFEMFGEMLDQVKHDTISILSRIRIRASRTSSDGSRAQRAARQQEAMEFQHAEASAPLGGCAGAAAAGRRRRSQPAARPGCAAAGATRRAAEPATPFVRDGRKVGRNEPCPCGSGKKYKQCHGKPA